MLNLPSTTIHLDKTQSEATLADMQAAGQILDMANDFVIDCPALYEFAAGELKTAKTLYKVIESKRKELLKPLDEARAMWQDFFRPALDALSKSETLYKTAMMAWERKQKEEAAKAEAEARKLVDAEKARLRAEQETHEAEQRKQREAAMEAAKAAQAATDEAERARLQRAADDAAQAALDAETAAQASKQMESFVNAPIIAPDIPKAAGTSKREIWSAEVTDLMVLVKAVAEGAAPISVLDANMKVLNGLAKSLRAELNIPGVKAVSKESMSVRT